MSDAAKIVHDLEALTSSLDLDRVVLAGLETTSEQRKDIQHHIARLLHSLRELELVVEGQEPDEMSEVDFPV